jgi:HEAT repeat protein
MSRFDRAFAGTLGLAVVLAAVALPAVAACAPATVAEIVARLDADAAAVRWDATTSLGGCGAVAVPALTQACVHEQARVRQGAARALGLIGPEAADAVPVLVAALADPDPLVRESAAEALGRLGPASASAIRPLVAAFADEDPYLGGAAAIALGRIGAGTVPALAEALTDARENVRWSAAIALGRLGPSAAAVVPALVRALGDTAAPVRASAAIALGAIGPGAIDAGPALTEGLHDRDEDVRRAARIALADVAPAWRAAPPARDQVIATIDRLVPQMMEEHHVPGVSIAVISEGQVAWSKAYGVSDAASKTPVTGETLIEAASMSKPVFAILALQLADEGRLDLDRPLVEYGSELLVPNQADRRRITARMALSHTAGFPNWRPGGEEREGPLPLLFEPGTRFGYSGEGVFYLQRVVERSRASRSTCAPGRHSSIPGMEGRAFPGARRSTGARQRSRGGRDLLAKSKYAHPNAAYTLHDRRGVRPYHRRGDERRAFPIGGSVAAVGARDAAEPDRPRCAGPDRAALLRPGRSVHWALGWSVNTTAGGDIYHHSGATGPASGATASSRSTGDQAWSS